MKNIQDGIKRAVEQWKLLQTISRSIQTYGAQFWGYTPLEDVNKLQRYLLKRILK